MERGDQFKAYGKNYTFMEDLPNQKLILVCESDNPASRPRLVDQDWIDKGKPKTNV